MIRRIMSWVLIVIGIFGIGVALAYAQTDPPAPSAALDFADRGTRFLEAVLAWVGSAGGVMLIGVVARLIPAISNRVVPYVLAIGNLIAVASLVLKKIAEAATGIAWVDDASAVHYAGLIGSIGGFVTVGLGAAAVGGAGAFQRFIWEKYLRHVFVPDSAGSKAPGF